MQHRMQKARQDENHKRLCLARRVRTDRFLALMAEGVPLPVASLMADDPDLSRSDAEAIVRYEATCPL